MKLTLNQREKLAGLTEFQRNALFACMKIPKGETRTYSEIAEIIGKPKAARAIGNALAKNPLAPLIPCHRVVRKNGAVGGYSAKGGARAKEKLLQQEKKKRRK